MSEQKPKQTWSEELEVATKDAAARIREIIEQGNVRRLIIRRKDGEVLMEVPLTASVIAGGALLVFAPMFAFLGALAAFVAEIKIEVVRDIDPDGDLKEKRKVDIE